MSDASPIQIGSCTVGPGHPCMVIAEAGVNHNGDPELAERLVRIAAEAGADAIKFQKRSIDHLLTAEALDVPYIKPTSLGATYGEHRRRLELDDDVWLHLRDVAREAGIEFLASPWDRPSVDFLLSLGIPAFKVASADVTSLDLLAYIADTGLPVILSTGMSSLEEIDAAVECLRTRHAELILLQCTSTYPTEFRHINLRVMDTYRERYGLVVGYSGHERGIAITEAAATLGAAVVERHFTVDRTLPGPDHAASLEPAGLRKLVRDIRRIEEAMGSADKEIAPGESDVRLRLAKSVVATRDIEPGTVIEAHMLTLKSPAGGLAANHLEATVGRVAEVAVPADTPLPPAAAGWQGSTRVAQLFRRGSVVPRD